MNLNNVTLYANDADHDQNNSGDGGGTYNASAGTPNVINIRNSIVASNWRGAIGGPVQDCYGTLTSGDYNLFQNVASCTFSGAMMHNKIAASPVLGQLLNNGGLTPTNALNPGSPAIDAGNPGGCKDQNNNNLTTDQRGYTRPAGAACDMGAFEVDGLRPAVTSIVRASANPTSAASVNYTVSFSEPMKGVSASNFSLTPSGVFGASISGVSGAGSLYTVLVSTGSGDGTLRLDVPVGSAITDLAGNPLSNLPFTSGEIYMVQRPLALASQASYDGWILESGELTNQGGAINAAATTFRLGDDIFRRQYRAILSFNTGNLPDDAVITDVKLNLSRQSVSPAGTNPFGIFSGLMIDVRKGFFGTSGALQAGDFQAAPAKKTVGAFKPKPSGTLYTITLPSAAYPYINTLDTRGGVTQLRLRFKLDDNNDSIANFISFYSGNAAANQPVLVITYHLP